MTARQKKPAPTFQVRFSRGDLLPERVPLRTLSDALAAVQRLASGRGVETPAEADDSLSLLDVRRGSAAYQCVAAEPKWAIEHLASVGKLVESPEKRFSEQFEYALHPLEELSKIARSLNTDILVQGYSSRQILVQVKTDTFDEVARYALSSGATQIRGTIVRVGGATEMKCAIRVAGRERLLYCPVDGGDVSRELGHRLYQDVTLSGVAQWLQPSWRIYSFRVTGVSDIPKRRLRESLEALRESGGHYWDKIDDPEAYLRSLR